MPLTNAPVVNAKNIAWLAREHLLDDAPLTVVEFMAHDLCSGLRDPGSNLCGDPPGPFSSSRNQQQSGHQLKPA
jgi:hypothetical protein